jgi:hypothetical protein
LLFEYEIHILHHPPETHVFIITAASGRRSMSDQKPTLTTRQSQSIHDNQSLRSVGERRPAILEIINSSKK